MQGVIRSRARSVFESAPPAWNRFAPNAQSSALVANKITATVAWKTAMAAEFLTVAIASLNSTFARTVMTKRAKKIRTPTLRFSPTAWAKLLFLRDYGDTEVGGFGIVSSSDVLLVSDIQLVKQTCSIAHVAFNDDAVADYFDAQVDEGLQPEQFARIWIHTHPGGSPLPSSVDEETFERVFGNSNWAVLFILACGGDSYARLRFNHGPRAEILIPVEIDFSQPFIGSNETDWEAEYFENVVAREFDSFRPLPSNDVFSSVFDDETEDWYEGWQEYVQLPEELAYD